MSMETTRNGKLIAPIPRKTENPYTGTMSGRSTEFSKANHAHSVIGHYGFLVTKMRQQHLSSIFDCAR